MVELLVSIAILGLVLSIVGVMIGIMSKAIGDTRKLLNCDDQARLIFTRMASDFARLIPRKDVDIIFAKQSGASGAGANDSIYFVTEASGSNSAGSSSYYTTTSESFLTLAGYCIAPDAQGTQINSIVAAPLNDLNRLGHALTWDTANSSPDNLVFVSFAAPTRGSTTSSLIYATTLAGTSTANGHWGGPTLTSPTIGTAPAYTPPTTSTNYGDYHGIGDQVFRFEYCFLLKDGTYSSIPIMTSQALVNYTAATGAATPAPTPTDDSNNTSGRGIFSAGSRWFDATNGRAFICANASSNNAVWAPLGVQDISAIVVAIAMLDRDSRLQITSAATYNALAGFFADSLASSTTTGTTLSALPVATASAPTFPNASPILMQQNWQATIDSPGFATAVGLPVSSASHIRIYQRYFYLNANISNSSRDMGSDRNERAGSALLVVLAFVVLLTGLILAFFSRSILEQQVSVGSANQVKVDNLMMGAVAATVSDLKQEIAEGSSNPYLATPKYPVFPISGNMNVFYFPPTALSGTYPSMLPSVTGNTTTGGAPGSVFGTNKLAQGALLNLIKISQHSQYFYPSGLAAWDSTYDLRRAAAVSTGQSGNLDGVIATSSVDGTSVNGRYISGTRWNKPFFTTQTTTFPLPDWIYVTRIGSTGAVSNPTTWNSNMIASASNLSTTTTVVGRYAYAIYDEGGLLDINVAGSAGAPNTVPVANYSYKNALAMADLTQIGLTQSQINTIVGWRNNASSSQSQNTSYSALSGNVSAGYTFSSANDTNYLFNVEGNPLGFLHPMSAWSSTSTVPAGFSQSDQFFGSRQQLIKFFSTVLGGGTTVNSTLQYLTHFSRDLNQPSFIPAYKRPTVQTAATGGNNANGLDFAINPVFLSVRAKTAFTRNDNSTAVIGEPLVKKRFNLNRIAWITPLGPMADDSGNLANSSSASNYVGATAAINTLTPIITQLETTYGMSDAFLRQGGPTNILKYFGLQWDSTNHRWNYLHGRNTTGSGNVITGSGTAAPGAIQKLQYTTDETSSTYDVYTSGREADFFELLKATIDVGAIAKTITTPTNSIDNSWISEYQVDSSVDYAIMQIGVNIIDQFRVDNYPTRILFNDGSGTASNLTTVSGQLVSPATTSFTLATTAREFRGCKNLPSIYRVRTMLVKTKAPTLSGTCTTTTSVKTTTTPPGTSSTTSTPTSYGPTPYCTVSFDNPAAQQGGNGVSASPTTTTSSTSNGVTTTVATTVNPGTSTLAITDTGLGALLYVPELWNPHDYNTSNLSQTQGIVGPTYFRMYAVNDANTIVAGCLGGAVGSSVTSIVGASASPIPYPTNPLNSTGTYYSTISTSGSGESRGMSQAGTEIDFQIPNNATGAALFREPTLCYQPTTPASLPPNSSNFYIYSVPFSGLNSLDGSLTGTTARTALGNINNVTGIYAANGGLNSAVTSTDSTSTPLLPTTGTGYIGFYLGCHPLLWGVTTAASTTPAPAITTQYIYGPRQTQLLTSVGTRYILQCQGPSGEWITCDDKYVVSSGNVDDNVMQQPQSAFMYLLNHGGIGLNLAMDPRTSRFGFMGTFDFNGYGQWWFPPWRSGSDPATTSAASTAWLNKAQGIIMSNRDGGGAGLSVINPNTSSFATSTMLWYPGADGTAVNFPGAELPAAGSNLFRPGLFSINNKNVVPDGTLDDYGDGTTITGTLSAQYYADPDGVVRRAMGGNDTTATAASPAPAVTVPATQPGQPQAIANTNGTTRDTASPSQSASRPLMLNRPFRSVADLGYVFSGTPWKNLDMSNPESGFSALLDVFSVGETDDPNGLVAGKVNLNTRQPLVLQAILTGAYRDELNQGATGNNIDTFGTLGSSSSVAYLAANALVNRTTSTTSGKGPLTNISELVGRWVPTTTPAIPIDGTSSSYYSGFSGDLTSSVLTTPATDAIISRYREATIRALANTGQTRVWNLMIDLVAQTGRFPASAATATNPLAAFSVEGEQRYWVHLAIDRYTGQVIDQQIEVVKE